MKKWEMVNKVKVKSEKLKVDNVIKILLENRGLKTRKEVEEFLHPKLEEVTVDSVGIKKTELKKALKRIEKAINDQEQIVVFGDYDVDGITGTAILWETLHSLGAKVLPYIPHRIDEGYGLSEKGISNIQFQISNIKLIITVDNGIVAKRPVDFANKQEIDVIITDHHTPHQKSPKAHAIVHTTKLCGAGVAWLLAQQLKVNPPAGGEKLAINEDVHLELAAVGTIADLVPLTGANRTIVKYGLEKLSHTKRPGLVALFKQAACDQSTLEVYQISHIIAPRLNAAGRLGSAMDSLRLLCTKDPKRADMLAEKLGKINSQRQMIMKESAEHAITKVKSQNAKVKNILIVGHESYQQGVIGLVAGKLVEEFYRPSIVLSIGEKHSKASARSIHGFNIIDFLRNASEFLVDVGGHPMAAGFTVETAKLDFLQAKLEELAEELLNDDHFLRTLRIDCEISLEHITPELYKAIQKLAPFGMANPEPTFVSRKVRVDDMRIIGRDGSHLKLKVSESESGNVFDAIAFGMAEKSAEMHGVDTMDIAYTIDENVWNGNTKLQLKVKDIKIN